MVKAIQITQATSYQIDLTNVPADSSVSTMKESGWGLQFYAASSLVSGNILDITGSDLVTNEAFNAGNLTYRVTLHPGWYLLGADTPTGTSMVDAIGLRYYNHQFNCHFDNTWSDDFLTYSNCTQASPPPAAPTGFENKTNLPVDTTFAFTTNFTNTALPHIFPYFDLNTLNEGTYLSVEISNPNYVTGSTPISSLRIRLSRNRVENDYINLAGYCSGATNQCSFQHMITHTNTYVLVVSDNTQNPDEIEVFTLRVKNFESSTDAISTATALVEGTIPRLDELIKYISLTAFQSLQIRVANFPLGSSGAANTTNFRIMLYSVIAGTSTTPPVYNNTINYASYQATITYDNSTQLYTVITRELNAGDYVLILDIYTDAVIGDFSVTYKTEAFTCPFNAATYPDLLQAYAGCTGGSTALSTFENLPTTPLATLQAYTYTTDINQALNPYKLDHPVIYPLGQLLAGDSLTVYVGVPDFDVNAVTMDNFVLRLRQGSVLSSGAAPASTTCDSSNR